MEKTTLAIADDHPIVVDALRGALNRVPLFHVVSVSSNGQGLLDSLRREPAEMVLTDFAMSNLDNSPDGFVLLRKLHSEFPGTRVVLLTSQLNPSILIQSVKLGVRAVVSKGDDMDEIIQTCIRVRSGVNPYYSPQARRAIETFTDADTQARRPELTPRELEVVRLFTAGHSLNTIASKLGRAPSTVTTQKHSAMKKLRATSNTDLIRFAYENGLDQ